MHIGVDEGLGLIHSITTMVANEHDITQVDKLLHGEEQRAWGDAGFQGVDKREEHKTREADWFIVMRPGKRAKLVKSDPLAHAEKSEPLFAQKRSMHFFTSSVCFITAKFVIAVWIKIPTVCMC